MKKSYSHYVFEDLADLGISVTTTQLFNKILPLKPTAWILETLAFNKTLPMSTEKARSELLIMPILLELKRQNILKITLFSGYKLDVDASRGLRGFCDFLISSKLQAAFLESPIIAVVEAKQDKDLIEAAPQCIAEMYAAQLFNEKHKTQVPVIYGTVTSGYEWIFMKLKNQQVIIDTERYTIKDLENLLGIWQTIIAEF